MSASASHGRVVSKELQSSKTCKRRAGPITATAGSRCLQAWYVYSTSMDVELFRTKSESLSKRPVLEFVIF